MAPRKNANGIRDAEWRGRVTATLEGIEKGIARIEANVAAVSAQVDVHDREITSLEERTAGVLKALDEKTVNTRLGWGARATIISATILAAASIVVALVK